MNKTFKWTLAERIAVKKAADSVGLSENEFIRQACNEKINRAAESDSMRIIQEQIRELREELDKQRSSLIVQITGAHKDLTRQLNSGIAGEFDQHLRTLTDVLKRFGETGKVYPSGSKPNRIDGLDLPPVIQKPNTK
jgi:hypothetical protein